MSNKKFFRAEFYEDYSDINTLDATEIFFLWMCQNPNINRVIYSFIEESKRIQKMHASFLHERGTYYALIEFLQSLVNQFIDNASKLEEGKTISGIVGNNLDLVRFSWIAREFLVMYEKQNEEVSRDSDDPQ